MESPGFGEWVVRRLRAAGVDARRLGVEVTETAAITNVAAVRNLAGTLRDAGCRLSLDDFGAGNTALAWLQQLPLDVLKLDRRFTASADDPIASGRHKVFGSVPWGIPPQTSTIASHLPKAVGMAVAVGRRAKLGLGSFEGALAVDRSSIVICSFGDASLNHSTAQGALNAASWAAFQRVPVPVLFVCEDNGIGVSVRTPDGWVEARMRAMPGPVVTGCLVDSIGGDEGGMHPAATDSEAPAR